MTNREITEWKVKLKDLKIYKVQQARVYNLIEEYYKAFSWWDEIGTSPWVEVHLKLHDKVPFFVCPYSLKEEQKK